MLISRISDENEGAGEGNGIEVERVSSQEYRTASELFDLMTKNCNFNDNDDDSFTTQDLVLLYKNIDIGTRLLNDATDVRPKKPNQHVETVVYNDEQESDSDLSDNFSADNLHDVFKINQERLNLFKNGSIDNILCHKLGGLEIKSSELAADYNKQFLFRDPYIKEQLKGLNVMASSSTFENILPTSLLDYICCKRLEDNYNFYMDNIIKYVQHTIEQLKRISNGEYLTDRAKEKWEEVKKKDSLDNTKVLATSTSIPLHVECKNKEKATWDDIVHSEVDVRSLSKILEKKIVVEIPKLICGSYRLFSKRCSDNLIISCMREKEDDESRLDVVLQLQRSQTGQVISTISSIMFLQNSLAVQDLRIPGILPITYKSSIDEAAIVTDDSKENVISGIESMNRLDERDGFEKDTDAVIEAVVIDVFEDSEDLGLPNSKSIFETNDYTFSDTERAVPYDNTSNQYSSDSSVPLRDILIGKADNFQIRNEATFNLISPDELRVTMQRLNMRASLPEEGGEDTSTANSKKKSPVRVRIKSPYENKSFMLEEKKRKRLLEIREKREKKKMALGENAKVSKHKYGKGTITPQPSNSVTKLSITNKSFYNSIYGESLNEGNSKTKGRQSLKKDLVVLELPIEKIEEEACESLNVAPEKNSKKYVNRSFYLDDTETEVMYVEMKNQMKATCSTSTSAVSNEFSANLNILSQLIGPSETDITMAEDEEAEQNDSYDSEMFNNSKDAGCSNEITKVEIVAPVNSAKSNPCERDDSEPKTAPVTLECKKSIDKLYNLMKKLGKASNTDLRTSRSRINTRTFEKLNATTGDSTIQGSDSGTSLKHHLTSSNPSCFSFGKPIAENASSKTTRKKEQAAMVVPKVIISSKLQSMKPETDKFRKDRKKVTVSPLPPKVVPENPLKAISQLLHEFDNVQKTRQKAVPETKPPKKTEMLAGDGKAMSRLNSFRRRSRLDQHTKENDQDKKFTTVSPKDKRFKPLSPMEFAKIPHLYPQTTSEDKHNNFDKVSKKKIADIIDEAKEARGEAVRGPSKPHSRLYNLAQPKKSYVQAHSEEYQHKYGKNLMADRLQRLATAPSLPPQPAEPIVRNVCSPTFRNRMRRDALSSVSVKQPPLSAQPIVLSGRKRQSSSNSPNRRSPTAPAPQTQKHNDSTAPETIKKMVAVESYVKNHYGPSFTLLQNELLLGRQTSRAPLLPNDIELDSTTSSPTVEDANELGKKLHRIIDCMISTAPPLIGPHETFELSRESTVASADDYSKDQRTDSDYNIDILEDKNVETVVESHRVSKRDDKEIEDNLTANTANLDVQTFSSTMELEKLENALYTQISGAFQKRLRIKNLTLTPKQSIQKAIYLQSGDAGSLLLKSTVSNLKINKCDSSLHDLKTVPMLSSTHLNWNFAHIPMQIATVGYTFPFYQPDCETKLDLKSLCVSGTIISEHGEHFMKNCQADKINQCLKGVHQEPKSAQKSLSVSRTAFSEHGEHFDMKNCKADKINQCLKEVHQEPKSKQAAQVSVEKIATVSKVLGDTEKTIAEQTELLRALPVRPKVIDKSLPISSDKKLPSIESSDNLVQASPSPTDVEYTTSLDMLVGLLNEIQKITCQKPGKDQSHNVELESMLTNASALEDDKPRDMVSLITLDKPRQMESDTSNYSCYISSEGTPSNEYIMPEPRECKQSFVDKEVSVNLNEKDTVNMITDVPSLLPIVVNHSTNMTNSQIDVISEPSSQTMVSITDYHTLYSNTFFSSQSIKEIVQPQIKTSDKLKELKKTDLNKKCREIVSPSFVIEQIPKSNRHSSVVHKIDKYYVKDMYLDPAIKIKRDILVTVYSILVLTVFAALSFPHMALYES